MLAAPDLEHRMDYTDPATWSRLDDLLRSLPRLDPRPPALREIVGLAAGLLSPGRAAEVRAWTITVPALRAAVAALTEPAPEVCRAVLAALGRDAPPPLSEEEAQEILVEIREEELLGEEAIGAPAPTLDELQRYAALDLDPSRVAEVERWMALDPGLAPLVDAIRHPDEHLRGVGVLVIEVVTWLRERC
ncbi:MAG TPA: hypothetical protein VEI97_14710 [bacterium]|nr:hypothetical protein [bacterium]